MKVTFKFHPNLLAFFCLFFAVSGFSQSNSRDYIRDPHAKPIRAFTQAKPLVEKAKNQPVFNALCDNDLVAPEVQCVAGNCQPNARAAYLVSSNGEPWGQPSNVAAMDAVFGSGNWDYLNFEYTDPTVLLSPAYKVVFLEGSEYGAYSLDAFLTANLPALENWVAAGGALFLNCAPNSGPGSINFGFGGVTLQGFVYSPTGLVQVPGHPIFNTPFSPAQAQFTGSSFSHGFIEGPYGKVLITDESGAQALLSEQQWGSGKVYFGGLTPAYFHSPQIEAQNMRQNILADLNALCGAGIIVQADAAGCVATIIDQSLDATATDDCVLASLTHDFAAAPLNTTLNGAVLPVGNTLIRWTATDATGNSNTCETLVSVREQESPVITCPSDISVSADPGICGAMVSFNISATDNCSQNPPITTSPAAGALYSNGYHLVTATATDESYNISTCSFFVFVTPNPELCNGIDDDCNGYIDDGAIGDGTFYADQDGDGYGDPNNSIVAACPIPYGYVFNALDCNDLDYYIRPGMYEICNGIDDNCDGNIDEGVAPTWYADVDGDGYGDPAVMQVACNPPQGYVSNNGDCTDTDAYIHPGALEDCTNLVDENCDGILGDNNFTIAETHVDVFCGSNPDGKIELTLTPAQNYPVFLWSNGTCCTTSLSNLDFGTYKVTVTNECGTSKTKTVAIGPPAKPALKVNLTGTDFICAGAGDGSISATPEDGCGGYTFEWSNGETQSTLSGLSGGDYTVLVTDACGCTKAATFTVNEPQQLYLYFANIIPLLDGTYFVQVVPGGGTAPYQFRRNTPPAGFTDWSGSNGFVSISPGDYVFEVQDAKGCTAQIGITLSPFTPRPMEGASEFQEPTQTEQRSSNQTGLASFWTVSLSPNPNNGYFSVDLQQPAPASMMFGITDQSGRLLFKQQVEKDSQIQNVDAASLPAGLYFLQIVSGGKVVAVEKFVKQ